MFSVFLEVLVPAFLVVGTGFLVARITGAKPQTLATLAYWVLGPVFIFDVLAAAEIDGQVVGKVVGATVVAMVAVGALAAVVSRILGIGYPLGAASVMTSIHGNVGNLGLAVSAFALGESVLPIAGIVMVTNNTLGILNGVGLATFQKGSARRAIRLAFTSPLALAVIPALLVNVNDLSLPIWLDRPLSLLAAALIPVMLLTLGIQIAGMPRSRPHAIAALPISLKLVIAPVVAWVGTVLLNLDGVAAQVVILLAAMPSAVFTSLIALEHDFEADYVTSVVLIGTLVSAATLPLVLSMI